MAHTLAWISDVRGLVYEKKRFSQAPVGLEATRSEFPWAAKGSWMLGSE